MGSHLREHCSTQLEKGSEWPVDGFVKADKSRLFEYVNKQVVLN
jgi:hypothetical protein